MRQGLLPSDSCCIIAENLQYSSPSSREYFVVTEQCQDLEVGGVCP